MKNGSVHVYVGKKVLWLKDGFIIVLIFKNLPHA